MTLTREELYLASLSSVQKRLRLLHEDELRARKKAKRKITIANRKLRKAQRQAEEDKKQNG